MARYKTFTNTSDILAFDLNTIQDIYLDAVGGWTIFATGIGSFPSDVPPILNLPYLFPIDNHVVLIPSTVSTSTSVTNTNLSRTGFYVDLTKLSVPNLNTIFRLSITELKIGASGFLGSIHYYGIYKHSSISTIETNYISGSFINVAAYSQQATSNLLKSSEFSIPSSGWYSVGAVKTEDIANDDFYFSLYTLEYKNV